MKITAISGIAAAWLLVAASVCAQTDPATDTDQDIDVDASPKTEQVSAELAQFCFFSGRPPSDVKYTLVRRLRVGKGSYGKVTDVLPRLTEEAVRRGADAMVNYTGSQRFGFFPWRVVRPVVRGEAIKWTQPPGKTCEALGGSTYNTIMTTDQPPA